MERTTRALWLEMIKVRSSEEARRTVGEIIQTLKSDPAVRNAGEVRVFSNEVGDIAVHISWESRPTLREGSSLGLRLAAALSEHGLINHTLWIEEV